MREKKIKTMLKALHALEALYLTVSIVIVFSRMYSAEQVISFTEGWIILSYLVLPLLLLKNILVGVLENRMLKREEKMWLIVRCTLYIFLTLYSYPLITAISNTSVCM